MPRVNRGEMMRRVTALRPRRSLFDLSYSKKFSGRMGYLYPVMHDEVVPGDVFDMSAECVVRLAPMVAPVLHEITLKADWFFVPYRIIYPQDGQSIDGQTVWERWITGGQDGSVLDTRQSLGLVNLTSGHTVPIGGLWDHLGIPTGVELSSATGDDAPLALPGYAYAIIYNEYYRDPNLEPVQELANFDVGEAALLTANWDADYFTRALPWQQRGPDVALPVSGLTSADWSGDIVIPTANLRFGSGTVNVSGTKAGGGSTISLSDGIGDTATQVINVPIQDISEADLDDNVVDLSSATSVTIADLRFAIQLQKLYERMARGGARYTEYLQSVYGVAPRDDRLNRPEYIGGIRQPIVVSEVLQTSKTETGAPQGNLAGHGIMAGGQRVGRYHVKEFGLIMCIMSIQPKPAYQQGINRQWLRRTRHDYYNPAYVNLAEQAIDTEEIYLQAALADNTEIWGYQGRYDEMRVKHDMVCGDMRSSLNYWHLGRIFSTAPALSSTFGHVDPTTVTRIFAVPSADHLYVHWGNKILASRPLPYQAEPGRIDHEFGGI